MAQYIDKAEALNVNFRISVNLFESRRKTAEAAVQAYADEIAKIPPANVRPVVLCKDCKYRSNEWLGCPKLNETITGDDFFCGCGTKREE